MIWWSDLRHDPLNLSRSVSLRSSRVWRPARRWTSEFSVLGGLFKINDHSQNLILNPLKFDSKLIWETHEDCDLIVLLRHGQIGNYDQHWCTFDFLRISKNAWTQLARSTLLVPVDKFWIQEKVYFWHLFQTLVFANWFRSTFAYPLLSIGMNYDRLLLQNKLFSCMLPNSTPWWLEKIVPNSVLVA